MTYAGNYGSLSDDASVASIAASFEYDVLAGDFLYMAVAWDSAGGTIVPTTITGGGTWTWINDPDTSEPYYIAASSGAGFAMAYCPVATGGATTVTVNFNAAASYRRIALVEYSDVGAIDQAAFSYADVDEQTFAAGPVTPTTDGQLIICAADNIWSDEDITLDAAGDFVKRVESAGDFAVSIEDQLQTIAGPISGVWQTAPHTTRAIVGVVTFQTMPTRFVRKSGAWTGARLRRRASGGWS